VGVKQSITFNPSQWTNTDNTE